MTCNIKRINRTFYNVTVHECRPIFSQLFGPTPPTLSHIVQFLDTPLVPFCLYRFRWIYAYRAVNLGMAHSGQTNVGFKLRPELYMKPAVYL